MKILWICPLDVRPNPFRFMMVPRVNELANTIGAFPLYFVATSANVLIDANRYAVGISEVTVDQLNALDSDSDIVTIAIADRGRQGRQLPPARKTKIDDVLRRVAGEAQMSNGETVDELLARVGSKIQPLVSVDSLLAGLLDRFGV